MSKLSKKLGPDPTAGGLSPSGMVPAVVKMARR